MNEKGFGLSELLVFIGIFLFILVAVTIYGRVKLGNESFYAQPDVDISEQDDEKYEEITINKDYLTLENKIKDAARKYQFDKEYDMIITLKELQSKKLINDLVDPNSKEICNGYVLFVASEKSYIPYINCSGYVTDSYNYEYEK